MRMVIIGAGRMGFVQARLARFFCDEILCCVEPQDEVRCAFEHEFHCEGFGDIPSARALLESADLIWCTTVDGAIESVGKRLGTYALRGVVLHTSGALSSEILRKNLSCPCGSLHPLLSCPMKDCGDALCVEAYRGVIHCFEGDESCRATAEKLVSRLGGQWVEISVSQKANYHAAAVFASNYPIILADIARQRFIQCGFGERQAHEASSRLLMQAGSALEKALPVEALTGPGKRRDGETIAMHRRALSDDEDVLALYESLLSALNRMCGYE